MKNSNENSNENSDNENGEFRHFEVISSDEENSEESSDENVNNNNRPRRNSSSSGIKKATTLAEVEKLFKENASLNSEGKPMKDSGPIAREKMEALGAHFWKYSANQNLNPKNSEDKKIIKQFKNIEDKGFFVSRDGCIFSHPSFWKGRGAETTGMQAVCHYFSGRKSCTKSSYDANGWPCSEEISHLCHRPNCVRPDHLLIEMKWQNQKRNYCGRNGVCDCGNEIPCVRTYHNGSFSENIVLETDAVRVQRILNGINVPVPPTLSTRLALYGSEDKKKRKRNKRLKAKKERKEKGEKNGGGKKKKESESES